MNHSSWASRLRLYQKFIPEAPHYTGGGGLFLFLLLIIGGVALAGGNGPDSVLAASIGGVQYDPISLTCDIPFSVEETLMFPTQTGVSFTAVPLENTKVYLEYGNEPGKYLRKTEIKSVNAGEAIKYEITALRPGTKYYYRVRCTNPGVTRFLPRTEHSFTTLRKANESFTFVYETDSHFYELWTGNTFGSGSGIQLETFNLSKQHILDENADFHIIGGDWAMTNADFMKGGTKDGITYAGGSTTTIDEALKRYVRTFSPEGFGTITPDLPVLPILGNHEGEQGFEPTILNASFGARQALFPSLPSSYNGDPEGRYYSFTSGSAKFIFIDVLRNTMVEPVTADDWTLGQVQLQWLQSQFDDAKNNRIPFVFVLAEHLDGGEKSYSVFNPTYYGRGGLLATLDNQPSGIFKGEQAQIQAMEETYTSTRGIVFFMNGHDHVAITPTEKPNMDGTGTNTYMVKGGRMGNVGGGWISDSAFKKEMDWDLSGTADYEESSIGTKKPGYFRINVNKSESVTFDYIVSDKDDPAIDGTVLFTKTIYSN
jgi:hypothetical protein